MASTLTLWRLSRRTSVVHQTCQIGNRHRHRRRRRRGPESRVRPTSLDVERRRWECVNIHSARQANNWSDKHPPQYTFAKVGVIGHIEKSNGAGCNRNGQTCIWHLTPNGSTNTVRSSVPKPCEVGVIGGIKIAMVQVGIGMHKHASSLAPTGAIHKFIFPKYYDSEIKQR